MLGRLIKAVRWRRGYASPPNGLDLKLTDACNLSCRYCPQWGEGGVMPNPPSFMDTPATLDLITQTAAFHPWFRLIGGEPLLHPDWARVVEAIVARDMICAAVTNGTLVAEQAELLVSSGLHRLGISVDGTAPAHDSQRGKGSLAQILDGVAALNSAKRRLHSETPLIEIYTTIHRDNYTQLVDFAEMLRDWGVAILRLQQLIWTSSEQFDESFALLSAALPGVSFFGADRAYIKQEGSGIDPQVLREQLQTLMSRDYPFALEVYPNLPPEELSAYHSSSSYRRRHAIPCKTMESYAFVDPRGVLHPCLTIDLGNVFERPFLRVWNGPRFRAYRRLIRHHGRLPFCHRCPDC